MDLIQNHWSPTFTSRLISYFLISHPMLLLHKTIWSYLNILSIPTSLFKLHVVHTDKSIGVKTYMSNANQTLVIQSINAIWSSVQFNCSVSDSLRPHGLQYARLPCPSPTPGTCSNSRPLSQWHPPTILSSVNPFSSCLILSSFYLKRLFSFNVELPKSIP